MAYKAGKVLTFGGNNNLVQRLQTSGPGSLNIPTERIRETGNELTVSVERDVPDLSFELESYDMSIATEAMMVRQDVSGMSDGDVITFDECKPIDIVAPIKGAGTSKTSVRGIVWPHLTLESATYRFGVGQNATQSFSLRGDSQYGVPGTPYAEEFDALGYKRVVADGVTTSGDETFTSATAAFTADDVGATISGTGIPASTTIASVTSATEVEMSAQATITDTGVSVTVGGDAYSFAETAIKTDEAGADVYAYGVTVYYDDGTWKRLYHGHDYSNTDSGFTLLDSSLAPGTSTVAVVYGSTTSASFPQTVHSTASVLPGAVRGKHINFYVGESPRRSFTATTTSGDATVTVASAQFTSADVGSTISGTGIPDGTLIDSFTSTTEIEMDANATASGTVTITVSPPLVRWRGVQSVEITWRVQLEIDQELGNIHNVGSDYDVPELSGTVAVKPETADYLFELWAQIGGAADGETTNLSADVPLEIRVVVTHPQSGATLKTWRVTDARIQPPPHQVRAGQKVETSFAWTSDSGLLEVCKGAWAS